MVIDGKVDGKEEPPERGKEGLEDAEEARGGGRVAGAFFLPAALGLDVLGGFGGFGSFDLGARFALGAPRGGDVADWEEMERGVLGESAGGEVGY